MKIDIKDKKYMFLVLKNKNLLFLFNLKFLLHEINNQLI